MNLRYEKGLKAWASLGPYLLGLAAFEVWVQTHSAAGSRSLWPWIAFLLYLVLFPVFGKKVLKRMRVKEARKMTVVLSIFR